MNKILKLTIVVCALVLFCLLLASCSNKTDPPYEEYDESGYTVSVKFDANGAYFGSAGNMYLIDTYNFDSLKDVGNDKKELFLIDPNSIFRNKEDRYNMGSSVVKGYFFAGWYTDRKAILNEDNTPKLDDKGNPMYSYSGYCDLTLPLSHYIDATPDTPYTADEPVLTLYAAWVRTPTIEIYENIDGEEVCIAVYEIKNANFEGQNIVSMPEYSIDPKTGIHSISYGALSDAMVFVPDEIEDDTLEDTSTDTSTDDSDTKDENAQSGETSEKYKWRDRERVTITDNNIVISTTFFNGFCADKSRNKIIEGNYTHPYVYDQETATIENPIVKLYVDFETRDGEWFRIYSAKEFVNKKATDSDDDDYYPLGKETEIKNCRYELMADIVFESTETNRVEWPRELTRATFEGQIIGNNHKIIGASFVHTDGNYKYAGLFRTIGENAVIKDIVFENATLTVQNAYKNPRGRYALIASTIEDGFAFENVRFTNSKLIISASATNIVSADYEVGLICAEGYHDGLGISLDGITCEALTSPTDAFELIIKADEASENRLLLQFIPKASE